MQDQKERLVAMDRLADHAQQTFIRLADHARQTLMEIMSSGQVQDKLQAVSLAIQLFNSMKPDHNSGK
jgi:hypothetical protein